MTTHWYIIRKSRYLQVWVIFRMPEVIRITCNMGALDMPDMYAPAIGFQA